MTKLEELRDAARAAYTAEQKKTQEEKQND